MGKNGKDNDDKNGKKGDDNKGDGFATPKPEHMGDIRNWVNEQFKKNFPDRNR